MSVFAAYEPDRAIFNPAVTTNILNVVPVQDGWGPMPQLVAYSQALPAKCFGATYVRSSTGSFSVIAGTQQRLYRLNPSTLAWDDISGPSAPYGVPDSDRWSFARFGQKLLASTIGSPLQIYDVDAPSTFVDAGGSPPRAKYVTVAGDFVMLAHLLDPAAARALVRHQRRRVLDLRRARLRLPGISRRRGHHRRVRRFRRRRGRAAQDVPGDDVRSGLRLRVPLGGRQPGARLDRAAVDRADRPARLRLSVRGRLLPRHRGQRRSAPSASTAPSSRRSTMPTCRWCAASPTRSRRSPGSPGRRAAASTSCSATTGSSTAGRRPKTTSPN